MDYMLNDRSLLNSETIAEIEYYGLELAHTFCGQILIDSKVGNTSAISRFSGLNTLCFEPAVVAILAFTSESVDTFIDIGANVGYYSIGLSSYFDKILSFEPGHFQHKALSLNCMMNKINNVESYNIALSDSSGVLPTEGSTVWSFHKRNIEKVIFDERWSKKGMSGTSFVIKIDVDGAEGFVLRGMKKILEESCDIVLEFRPSRTEFYGDNANEICCFMDQYKYNVYQIVEKKKGFKKSDLDIMINGELVGYLRAINSLHNSEFVKGGNYFLTRRVMPHINVEIPFLKKKLEIQKLLKNRHDKVNLSIIAEILTDLKIPFFYDQFACCTENKKFAKIFLTLVEKEESLFDLFPSSIMQRAMTLYDIGEYEKALLKIRQCENITQSDPFILINVGKGFIKAGENAEALNVLKRVIAIAGKKKFSFGDNLEKHQVCSDIYIGVYELALDVDLKCILQELPEKIIETTTNPHQLYKIAEISMRKGEVNSAAKFFWEAAKSISIQDNFKLAIKIASGLKFLGKKDCSKVVIKQIKVTVGKPDFDLSQLGCLKHEYRSLLDLWDFQLILIVGLKTAYYLSRKQFEKITK